MGELLESPRPEVAPELAATAAERLWGIECHATPLPGERDANFRLDTSDGPLCLKIANRLDDLDVVAMQALALEHVSRVDGSLPVPGVRRTQSGAPAAVVEVDGASHAALLTDFLPGATPGYGESDASGRAALGALVARLDRALRGFFHPSAGRQLLWDVSQLAQLRPRVGHVAPDRRSLVERWLDTFDRDVAPRLVSLRAQPIHGDVNQGNLLLDPDTGAITGVVDFGDMVHAALVLDPAVAAAYQCFRQEDLPAALSDLVVAYDEVNPLEADEIRLFPLLVGCRLAQSVAVAAWRATLDPENSAYIEADEEDSWQALARLSELDLGKLGDELEEACAGGLDHGEPAELEVSLARRRARLGPALSLSYDQPLRPVRGEGVWLIDADGERHLDAYNNVPHVGHSHPHVVAAQARQAARLTTNTRYLVDSVTDYADRLAGLLPEPLEVVMFVNSGSEANDVAYQIACVASGNRGVILTEHAYHGCTWATTAMSPEEFGLGRIEPWGATVPAPHPQRVDDGAADAAEHIDGAVRALVARGHAPAMWIADGIFSSDGIFPPPRGYLREAYARTRAAGGICVADEVQAGFGRIGTPFWGFACDDAVPDVVTLGKPIGNGHPMGAVITTRELAERFAAGWHFFSTFAGSPVAAAAGSAVLDVVERDRLPEHAERVGDLLRERITDVLRAREVAADVRGAGLFVGVEMLDESEDAARERARDVVEAMRRRRVLIGRTGPRGNVLKIRPPLVFDETHVEVLADALDESLGD